MLRFDLQHRALAQCIQMHPALDLRLSDVPVHLIAETGLSHDRTSYSGSQVAQDTFPEHYPFTRLYLKLAFCPFLAFLFAS